MGRGRSSHSQPGRGEGQVSESRKLTATRSACRSLERRAGPGSTQQENWFSRHHVLVGDLGRDSSFPPWETSLWGENRPLRFDVSASMINKAKQISKEEKKLIEFYREIVLLISSLLTKPRQFWSCLAFCFFIFSFLFTNLS